MPNYCLVPGCNNNYNPECRGMSFYTLPLDNPELINWWLIKMHLSIESVSEHSRICSKHFIGGKRHGKGNLFPWNSKKRKPPTERCLPPPASKRRYRYTTLTEKREIVVHDHCYTPKHNDSSCTEMHVQQSSSGSQFLTSVHVNETHVKLSCDAATNTVSSQTNSVEACRKITEHSITVTNVSSQTVMKSCFSPFSIEQIAEDDQLVCFYTGFKDYDTLMICYEFLGSCVYHLQYC